MLTQLGFARSPSLRLCHILEVAWLVACLHHQVASVTRDNEQSPKTYNSKSQVIMCNMFILVVEFPLTERILGFPL